MFSLQITRKAQPSLFDPWLYGLERITTIVCGDGREQPPVAHGARQPIKIGQDTSCKDSLELDRKSLAQLSTTLDECLCAGTVNLPTWYVSQALVKRELRHL